MVGDSAEDAEARGLPLVKSGPKSGPKPIDERIREGRDPVPNTRRFMLHDPRKTAARSMLLVFGVL